MLAIEWLLAMAVAMVVPGGVDRPDTPDCGGPGTYETTSGPPAAALHLVLNIPAYRLDVFDGAERVRSYTVAVGSRRYPTPTGTYLVDRVTWNPWWYPPDSEWAKKERPTPPGPENPVGKVKLQFRELYYLHGTPYEASLGSAASHGCVRLADRDVVALARLVHEHASPELPPAALDSLGAGSRETVEIPLSLPVVLRITYEIAELRDGVLEIHPDVYRKVAGGIRERVLQVLGGGGYPADAIDPTRLDSLLRRGRDGHVGVRVEELLAPGWTEGATESAAATGGSP